MSRLLHEIHTKCNCMCFNWRTGITTISIITETIQLAIMYFCMLILKCLKTHIGNVRNYKKHYNEEDEQEFPSIQAINELKVFYFTIIIYALVIFIFGIICSVLLISGAKKCQSKAVLSWLIYQGFFLASSFVIAYILIKVRDDKKYVYSSMEHKTFYDLSTGIYWVTFITFLPVLLYFWKRVLFFYMQMIKGTIQASNAEDNNNFIIDSNTGQCSDDDDEHQSVAFVKNVTLDIEH
ncbi:hypothetical protein ACKWTF_004226 [Chironomus riparius]